MHQLFSKLDLSQNNFFRRAALRDEQGVEIEPLLPGSKSLTDCLEMQFLLAKHGRGMTEDMIAVWLAPLVAALKFGAMKDPSEVDGRLSGMKLALEGVPSFLFTRELQRDCLRKFEYFPVAAEIWKLVEAPYAQFERAKMLLNRLLDRRFDAPLLSAQEAEQALLQVSSNEPQVRLVR